MSLFDCPMVANGLFSFNDEWILFHVSSQTKKFRCMNALSPTTTEMTLASRTTETAGQPPIDFASEGKEGFAMELK